FSRVYTSLFEIPIGSYNFPYTVSNYGVFTDKAIGIRVEGCTFSDIGVMDDASGRNLGVSCERQGARSHVYRNIFNGLETQTQSRKMNKGLQIDCNTFNRSENTTADIHMAGPVLAPQG